MPVAIDPDKIRSQECLHGDDLEPVTALTDSSDVMGVRMRKLPLLTRESPIIGNDNQIWNNILLRIG